MRQYLDLTRVGCGVYAIVNTRIQKMYIGSTSSFARRWQEHKDQLNSGTHANYKLQADWRLYGAAAFEFNVIERCAPVLRLDREQYYIDHYRSAVTGYNLMPYTRPSGERGVPTLSTRSAIRALRRKQIKRH